MRTESGLTLAAIIATLPLLSANAAQTLDFGPNLPPGTVPDGYAGFDWHGAQNDVFADTTVDFFGSLFITELSRTAPFDLNSMVVQELNSDAPSAGETSNVRMVFGQPVFISSPDLTLVSQLTVDNFVAKAPEIDPATAASALTLLIGGVLVSTGRRRSPIARTAC
ncbi:MAG: hypothetical protein ABI356_07550 [Steroidobacteraceae bacterium]